MKMRVLVMVVRFPLERRASESIESVLISLQFLFVFVLAFCPL